MKLIIAVIQPSKLEEVKAALSEVEVVRLTIMDVQGFGRQKGHKEIYRGAEYVVNFVPKIKLELVVPDQVVAQAIETLSATAKTGKIGDGKIFVSGIEESVRIRTGERGPEAI